MRITLTNVSDEQLTALRNNFEDVFISPTSETKSDVTLTIETELECWKLFFSGADYTLAKMGRVKL